MKKNNKKFLTVIGAVVAIVCIIIFAKYSINNRGIFTDMDKFKDLILSYGSFSFLAFLLLQVIQIVFFFIPGEVVQVAGGYIFGPYVSFILCIVGAIIGSAIAFTITRKFGKPFLQKICGKNNLWIIKKLDASKENHKKHRAPKKLIFILYLIPGVPKDLLAFICGVADISLKDFLIISTIGRAPALFFSCVFGSQVSTRNWTELIIVGSVFILVFGVLFIFTRKHLNRIKQDVEN